MINYFAIPIYIEENTKLVKGAEESLHGSRSSGDWHHLQGEIQQSYQQLQVNICRKIIISVDITIVNNTRGYYFFFSVN